MMVFFHLWLKHYYDFEQVYFINSFHLDRQLLINVINQLTKTQAQVTRK